MSYLRSSRLVSGSPGACALADVLFHFSSLLSSVSTTTPLFRAHSGPPLIRHVSNSRNTVMHKRTILCTLTVGELRSSNLLLCLGTDKTIRIREEIFNSSVPGRILIIQRKRYFILD